MAPASWCVTAGEVALLVGGMIRMWRPWSSGRFSRIGCSPEFRGVISRACADAGARHQLVLIDRVDGDPDSSAARSAARCPRTAVRRGPLHQHRRCTSWRRGLPDGKVGKHPIWNLSVARRKALADRDELPPRSRAGTGATAVRARFRPHGITLADTGFDYNNRGWQVEVKRAIRETGLSFNTDAALAQPTETSEVRLFSNSTTAPCPAPASHVRSGTASATPGTVSGKATAARSAERFRSGAPLLTPAQRLSCGCTSSRLAWRCICSTTAAKRSPPTKRASRARSGVNTGQMPEAKELSGVRPAGGAGHRTEVLLAAGWRDGPSARPPQHARKGPPLPPRRDRACRPDVRPL